MSAVITPRITQAGIALMTSAQSSGIAVQLTHIAIGSELYETNGSETALRSEKMRQTIGASTRPSTDTVMMRTVFTPSSEFWLGEVGFYAGSTLFAVWSAKDAGVNGKALGYATPGVDWVMTYRLVIKTFSPGTLTVVVDPNLAQYLASLTEHEAASDPHPQYTTVDEVNTLIEARVGDYVVATAVGNAYTVTLDPPVVSYTSKTMFAFKAPASVNTGATTMNAGGGARPLVRDDGTAMQAGDIPAGSVAWVVYDVATSAFRVTETVLSQTGSQIAAAIDGLRAESDSKYPLKNGTFATGTWPINISGQAATANYANSAETANTANFATTATTAGSANALTATALAQVYPVGSIYINASSSTNPGALLGFGTWTAFGAGRVMVGFDGGDALFNAAEKTGGSKDATLVWHNHQVSGTTGNGGYHRHAQGSNAQPGINDFYGNAGPAADPTWRIRNTSEGPEAVNAWTSWESEHSHSFSATSSGVGSSATNANVQPYITVYMWKRVA